MFYNTLNTSAPFATLLYRIILLIMLLVTGSIALICPPIVSMLSGLMMEFFGRKCSMILGNIPFAVGWLLCYFSNSVSMLFYTNIIFGIGIGFMEAPVVAYLGEIGQPQVTAFLTSLPGSSRRPENYRLSLHSCGYFYPTEFKKVRSLRKDWKYRKSSV